MRLGTQGCVQWEVFSHPPQLLSSCSWDPSLFSAVMYPQSLWFGWMLPQCQHAPPKCYCQPKPSGAYSDCPDKSILKMWQHLCLYFKPILCTVLDWFCMNIFWNALVLCEKDVLVPPSQPSWRELGRGLWYVGLGLSEEAEWKRGAGSAAAEAFGVWVEAWSVWNRTAGHSFLLSARPGLFSQQGAVCSCTNPVALLTDVRCGLGSVIVAKSNSSWMDAPCMLYPNHSNLIFKPFCSPVANNREAHTLSTPEAVAHQQEGK